MNVSGVSGGQTVGDCVNDVVTHVPMSPVGAQFNEALDTTYTEVKAIAPLEPLAVVKILPPDLSFVGSEQLSYENLNYLRANMQVGDFSYVNYLKLYAENAFGAEYYGFSGRNGHWIVAHSDGTEWTEDDAPVVLSRDSASGYTRYTAVKPGSCVLKYLIDEDCYSTINDVHAYTKNADLLSTAALEITVSERQEEPSPPAGTVRLFGSFVGAVGEEPQRLDKDGGLIVSIWDLTGRELDKPYVWEKQELDSKGILMSDANEISFTKPGTYHVRVVCDEIGAMSDWYEIHAHDYSYSADEATITAVCSEPGCESASVTVSAPDKTVYNDRRSARAKLNGAIPGVDTPAVVYKRGTVALDDVPRDAGSYTASITLGGVTASVDYTIEAGNAVYNGTYQPVVAITVKEGSGLKLWCSFDRTNTLAGTPKKKDAGAYEIWYKVSGSGNYEDLGWSGPILAELRAAPLTITAQDAAKLYDGSPLTCVACTADSLPDGYTLSDPAYSGSIIEAGMETGAVTGVRILNANGIDVTKNYDVRFVPGRLIVLAQPSFAVPAMLESIDEGAFAGIAAESVEIGAHVRSVGAYAFAGCEKLTALVILGMDTALADTALTGSENAAVYAPAGSAAETFAGENGVSFIPLLNPQA